MLEMLGSTLVNAVAVAICPLPIITVILLLMSPRATKVGTAFLIGWVVGILLLTTVTALIAQGLPEPAETDGSQPVIGAIQLLLGALLVLLAVRQWRSRSADGEEGELPAWMSKLDSMKVPAVAGLALVLAAANPKNLLLVGAAGTVIGRGSLGVGGGAVVIVSFAIVASVTVLVPVAFAAIAPKKAAAVLTDLRTWLVVNNSVIMTVVFTIVGAQIIGKGMGSF